MRDDVVRLSFDISVHEHASLKAACAEAMIPMKDFLHDLVLRGIQELREKRLQEKSTRANHEMHNVNGMQMQDSPHNMKTVSWLSQEEEKKARHGQENINWMQSKPEDSMGGHIGGHRHGRMGQMKNMSKENM